MYCGNNPVNNQDSSGQFWDIALDVVFTVGSLIAVAKNPTDLKAWAALGADLICTAIPFATGGGLAVRAVSKVDDVVDNYASLATKTNINNGTLYQVKGRLNGKNGRFEWIVDNNKVTHRLFVEGGEINGMPSKK